MKTLKTLFLVELADRYDAEKQLAQAMPQMVEAASSAQLKKLIQARMKQAESHTIKLERIFELFEESPLTKRCEGAMGIIKEATGFATVFKGSPAIDAALISVAQKMVQYETVSFACLREWALALKQKEVETILMGILEEEGKATKLLLELARSRSNHEALGKASPGSSHKNGNRAPTVTV